MNRRNSILSLAAAGLSLGLAVGWSRRKQGGERQSLLIGGATAMLSLNTALSRAWMRQHGRVNVQLERGSSMQGLIAARRGAIDLAAITYEPPWDEQESDYRCYLIARGEISIVVHPDSPLTTLSRTEVHALLSGKITNWQQLGAANAPVQVMSRTHGSSTRQFVEETILHGDEFSYDATEFDSPIALSRAVAATPTAISYLASKDRKGCATVKTLMIDQVAVSPATIYSGRYPYGYSLYLYRQYGERGGLADDFIQFARGAEGQTIVAEHGMLPVA